MKLIVRFLIPLPIVTLHVTQRQPHSYDIPIYAPFGCTLRALISCDAFSVECSDLNDLRWHKRQTELAFFVRNQGENTDWSPIFACSQTIFNHHFLSMFVQWTIQLTKYTKHTLWSREHGKYVRTSVLRSDIATEAVVIVFFSFVIWLNIQYAIETTMRTLSIPSHPPLLHFLISSNPHDVI